MLSKIINNSINVRFEWSKLFKLIVQINFDQALYEPNGSYNNKLNFPVENLRNSAPKTVNDIK